MQKILTLALSAAALGFAAPAMAQQIDGQNYNVNVNVQVAEEVSLWASHENRTLVLEGNDANNFAASESAVNYINNVPAKIDVAVTGNLPAPLCPGNDCNGGVVFYVFDGVDAATAQANTLANAYAPAGALVWTYSDLGTSREFDPNVGVNTTAVSNRLVTYAAASPGELPLPGSFDVDVLWTIAPIP